MYQRDIQPKNSRKKSSILTPKTAEWVGGYQQLLLNNPIHKHLARKIAEGYKEARAGNLVSGPKITELQIQANLLQIDHSAGFQLISTEFSIALSAKL